MCHADNEQFIIHDHDCFVAFDYHPHDAQPDLST